MAKDIVIYPEPGEKFAVAGEVVLKIKGLAHSRREGNLVVTDRRIAFKGNLTWDSWLSIARRAVGRGGMDLSIPYSDLRRVRRKGYWSGYHFELYYLDEEADKVRRLRVRILKWSLASKGLGGARLATEAVHTGEIVAREVNFLPIVGDFLEIGADFAAYRAGSKAAEVWIETIETIKNGRGFAPAPAEGSRRGYEERQGPACRQCRAPIDSSWKACPECGTDVRRVCQSCGAELEDDWISCPSCGEDIPILCQGCGAKLETDWITCPSCGEDLHRV